MLKMWGFIFISLFLLAILRCGTTQETKPLEPTKTFPEYDCASQGGFCVVQAECPMGMLTRDKGLCPKQQALGVECCYALSKRETRCKKRGGDCVPKSAQCPDFYMLRAVTGCAEDEKCCVYVK